MKTELIKILNSHNDTENGILISIPIEEYVTKITQFATVIPYWVCGDLKGFIAYYNNDESKEMAFLTMILIGRDFQSRGLGKLLLEFSINDLTKNGFKNYGLEVLKSNENAIRLYVKLGFIKKKAEESYGTWKRH